MKFTTSLKSNEHLAKQKEIFVDNIKKARAENTFLREITAIIRERVSDPEVGFVTFLRVKVSKDGKFAKVYYNALGDDKSRSKTQNALTRCAKFIQFEIGKKIRVRNIPHLSFFLDKNLDYAMKMEEIFNKNLKEDSKKTDE